MLKNEKGEFGLIPLLTLLFGSVLIASAVVLNSTDNSSVNITLNDTLVNLSLINNLIVENITNNITTANETINLTIPVDNATIQDQSIIINDTINLTLPINNFSTIEAGNSTSNITIYNQTDITIPNQSINLSEGIFNLSNITLNYSAIIIENLSINLSDNVTRLAKVFDEDNLEFDRELRKEYLDWHKNFSDLNFKNIVGRDEAVFSVGARNDNIKGFNINNKKYALHLIYCDSYHRYCIFKINGVPSKRLYSFSDFGNSKINSFDFDELYSMKITSVEFDFCDNRRFCHLGYEGYHVVNVSIEVKG